MRSPLLLVLGSSLLLSQVHAAPRITARPAAPVRIVAAAKTTRIGQSPSVTLPPHQIKAVAGLADDKFGKLIGLFGAPRADIKNGDPTTKEGSNGVVAGSKVFVKGVKLKDVDQGHLGDCYFVAALAAVAYTNPALIKKDLVENKDGTLSLRMFHQTSSGKYEADTVNMTKAVPLSDGRPTFARGSDPTQMWPAYFQKGYVMQRAATQGQANAFPAIEGGVPGDAFATLTGKPSQHYAVSPTLGDQLFTVMQKANKAKNPVAAWTPKTVPEGVVHGDHTYTILGVSEHDGKKFVQLRNPWGYSPGNDGIFELDMLTFAKTFVGLDVGG